MDSRESPSARSADPGVLLRQIGAGSVSAFAAFYDEFAPGVHAVTMTVLTDPEVAERATEAVFLRVWRCAPRFRTDRQTPMVWVLSITFRELARDRPRQEARAQDPRRPAPDAPA